MPFYMDRHDVPGATARDAAEAHVNDLEVADEHNVQFFSYWFDANTSSVFCFAQAPDRNNLVAVHQASHGLVPNEIIEVAEDDVLRFLGRVHDPADETEVTSPFRTILFTDIEGSTEMLEAVGQTEYMKLLQDHDLIVRRAIVGSRGREVKHTGDGIMASFDEVDAALECGLTIRSQLASRNAAAVPPLRVRIGMAAGEPVDHNDDIFGVAVHMANRLCNAATAERTLVSSDVRDGARDSRFLFGERLLEHLKGFPEPVPAHELLGSRS